MFGSEGTLAVKIHMQDVIVTLEKLEEKKYWLLATTIEFQYSTHIFIII